MQYAKYHETSNPHEYHFLTIPCPACKGQESIVVKGEDLFSYNQGALMQVAFPYLTSAQRERLITGYCDPCFDKLFKEEDDE